MTLSVTQPPVDIGPCMGLLWRMDMITANLPSRDFTATAAFYARLGFDVAFQDDGWMILRRGDQLVEFFPHPDLDPKTSWFSACLRVDDIDATYTAFANAGLTNNSSTQSPLTPPEYITPTIRMFAFTDQDGSLWRCLQIEAA